MTAHTHPAHQLVAPPPLCLLAACLFCLNLRGPSSSCNNRAFELLCHMVHRARPANGAGPPSSFWSLPYDPGSSTPQLVVQIERYVLPQRNLKVKP